MAKVKGDIIIDIERCKGCELCIDACPQDALEASRQVNKKGYLYIVRVDDTACTGCTNCALVCPEGGITVYRQVGGKKEQIAKVSNVTKDMDIKVS